MFGNRGHIQPRRPVNKPTRRHSDKVIPLSGSKVKAAPKLEQINSVTEVATTNVVISPNVMAVKDQVQGALLKKIDVSRANEMARETLAEQIGEIVAEILQEQKINLNLNEQRDLITMMLHDMLGLGPLEPLLADDDVTDIMVNGPKQVYVEKNGKLQMTDVTFRDNAHALNIAQRIVAKVGRRVDESSPLCDARLEDGSRVNIIIPPLSIDGCTISIRKFSKMKITLDRMVETKNLSAAMAQVLKIASRSRVYILICGGAGFGQNHLAQCFVATD